MCKLNQFQPVVAIHIETSREIKNETEMGNWMYNNYCIFNPLRANATNWLNTLKHFAGNSRRIVWMCLTILWGWRLKGYRV